MLKLIFLTIILYIIIQQFLEEPSTEVKTISGPDANDNIETQVKVINQNQVVQNLGSEINKIVSASSEQTAPSRILETREGFANDEIKVLEFDKPNPWSKVIVDDKNPYPFLFHIKLRIPSLNDYESWKQIVPNIEFIPRTGELIIPSKDEASALALANLISINFTGQMSLQNILDKNLIQISVSKAKAYEVVQNKLREQIMENLYGKQFNTTENNFERDLARGQSNESMCNTGVPVSRRQSLDNNGSAVDFQSDNFTDTFEHFSGNNNKKNSIEAWDGNDYSYL